MDFLLESKKSQKSAWKTEGVALTLFEDVTTRKSSWHVEKEWVFMPPH